MDNLTRTLTGIGLARAGLAQRLGRGTNAILALASNLPDGDVVCLAGASQISVHFPGTGTG